MIDLTTRTVQVMVPRGRGAILNVGSTAGFHPFPGQSGYAQDRGSAIPGLANQVSTRLFQLLPKRLLLRSG